MWFHFGFLTGNPSLNQRTSKPPSCRSTSSSSYHPAGPHRTHQNSFGPPTRNGRPRHCQSISAAFMAALRRGHSWPHRHPCRALSKLKHKIKIRPLSDLWNRCSLQVSRCRPAARSAERLRYSPVPWNWRARCQHIGFKAAMALPPCEQRRNLEESSAARSAPAKIPEGNHSIFFSKHAGFFSRMFGEKYGENGDKFRFVTMST